MINIENTKYEGMGFVEALIAIMIVGASSVVLMQMASRTLQDMMQNEVIDTMTQYAVEGSTMIQNVAMQEKTSGLDVFPNSAGCYAIENSDGLYSFKTTDTGLVTYDISDRNSYKEEAMIPGTLFFRIFCIDSLTSKYAVVKVIVGQSNTNDGSKTFGNNVKDYTYFTVANL